MHQDYDEDMDPYLVEQWEAIIQALMKLGLMEQLVGEDGGFYYRLTELGLDFIKGAKDGKRFV